jgi:hypothetical protein
MKMQPVLVIGLDGETPIQPLQTVDLAPLATEATMGTLATEATVGTLAKDATEQQILLAIQSLLQPIKKAGQVTIDLTAAKVDVAVDLRGLVNVQRVFVADLSGTTATLKFGTNAEDGLELAAGRDYPGLNFGALYINSPGGAGGSVTLQLFGHGVVPA